jgi:coenzyme PQQ biosynthesis protein C
VSPLSPEAFLERLRDVGVRRYHDRHPFHQRLHSGRCARARFQAWALNRYAYQAAIPRKDLMQYGQNHLTAVIAFKCQPMA